MVVRMAGSKMNNRCMAHQLLHMPQKRREGKATNRIIMWHQELKEGKGT